MGESKFNEIISQISKVLILTHEDPDGDAIASILALNSVLRLLGKETKIVSKDGVPSAFSFLSGIGEISRDFLAGDYEAIFILDCGDLRRTGFSDRIRKLSKKKYKIINIDHHPRSDLHKIVSLNIVDSSACSTAEILYRLFFDLGIPLDKEIATYLLTGIYTDTGGFRHSNTTPRVLEIASRLMSKGARISRISKEIAQNKTIPALKLWGKVLDKIHWHRNLGLVCSLITQKDLHDCQASNSDLQGVVNLINTIPQSRAAILFSETPDGKIKASLRTEEDKVDVSRLAALFGGGGHRKAAGFEVPGRILKTGRSWKILV